MKSKVSFKISVPGSLARLIPGVEQDVDGQVELEMAGESEGRVDEFKQWSSHVREQVEETIKNLQNVECTTWSDEHQEEVPVGND